MNSKLLSVLALVAILFLGACKDDEKKLPANVIQDADGVTIELRWSTGGSDVQAIEDADLDLYILDGTSLIGESVSGSSFEEIVLDEDYDDEEYTIAAYLFENYAGVDVDFVITITGGDKDFEAEGSFSSTDPSGSGASLFTIKKAGNKYTVEED